MQALAAEGGSGGGGSSGALRRLVTPFAGYSLAEVQLVLRAAYNQEGMTEQLETQPWGQLLGSLRLADQLHASHALQLLESAAVAKLGQDCIELEHWRPALEAADGLQDQAPRLYERTLKLATAALLNSMRTDAAAPLLAQQLLIGNQRAKLSPATQARLFATFAAGVRAVAAGSGSNCGWGLIASNLATEGEYRGRFTWTWEPGYGSDDLNDPIGLYMEGGALSIPITVQLSFRRADLPAKEWKEWCWNLVCRVATLARRCAPLLLAWAACAVASYLVPLWGGDHGGDGGASVCSAQASLP
ncbi:hypothetical protein ABPG77_006553 [Micractinium sp. CCAP 211/92]